ncbi:MAG: DNA-processing protein DprA [Candidatus Portnoybacteria bacterium]|nr:DNA-processing protein DprA [Candidatus Portnoybacteria bacterium]MDD4982620.1 DNA-processing protein DprA [Candidatus Portnoybacteria bacterium]
MHPQAKYFHAFNLFNERIGPMRFKKLLGYFGSLEQAWKNGSQQDFVLAGLEEDLAQEIAVRRPQIDLEKELAKLDKENIGIITILDEDYPKLLKEIYDPPHIMYIKGELKQEDEFAIAVVGTRKLSTYGQQVTTCLSRELAQAGLTIVSGLALGIDTLAHLAALEQKTRTIAVLGSSIDRFSIFPAQNKSLAEKIAQNGAVLSEYPMGSAALPHHFPARNRIVSGLSLGTLVVEAPQKSGAMITANSALSQNREVFAVPGSIFSDKSTGPNSLIKNGAKLAVCAQDILEELNLQNLASNIAVAKIAPDNPEEESILKILSHDPLPVDLIVQETKMSAAVVNATLSIMEMKGKIKNLGGMQYVLAR